MEANGYTKEEGVPGGTTVTGSGGGSTVGGGKARQGGCKTCNELNMNKNGNSGTNESVS